VSSLISADSTHRAHAATARPPAQAKSFSRIRPPGESVVLPGINRTPTLFWGMESVDVVASASLLSRQQYRGARLRIPG
jgi:hypothetical protein